MGMPGTESLNNFINPEMMAQALGEGGMEQLAKAATNRGAAFLEGKATSSFVKIATQKNTDGSPSVASTLQSTAGAAANAIGIAETRKGVVENPEQLEALVMDLVNMAMDIMMKEMTKMVEETTKEAAQMVMSIPTDIATKSMKHFNEKKKSITACLADLMKITEDEAEKKVEESQEKEKNQKIEKVKETANKVHKAVDDFMGEANKQLSKVALYIQEGPDFIQKKTNDIIKEQVEKANKFKDKQMKIAKEDVDKFTDKQGEKVGTAMAEKYNKIIMKQAEKKKNKIEQQKKVAITKMKASLQKVNLKLMAMTGINIPL